MSRNPYQRRKGEPAVRVLRVREVEVAVDGDRVVQRLEDRPAVVHHPEQAGAEALVVVDDVEVGAAVLQEAAGAQQNVYGSGKPAPHMIPNSCTSMRVLNSVRPRHAERVLGHVEVEAGHLGELRRVVELGVGLAGEHRDLVAELGELPGQVTGVDALTAAVRVAPVHEPRDAKSLGRRHTAVSQTHPDLVE